MACYYNDGNKNNITTSGIMKMFFEENLIIENSEIYSSEQLQKNTIDRILNADSKSKFSNSESPTVTSFIVEPNPQFKGIRGLEGQDRLSPEYILTERIKNHVINERNNMDFDDFTGIDPEVEQYYNEHVEKFNQYESLKNNPNKAKGLIKSVLDEVKYEEANLEIGKAIHKLIELKINDDSTGYNSEISRLINNDKAKLIFGSVKADEWISKIDQIVDSIIKTVSPLGSTLTEISIVHDKNTTFPIKGKIDLVAIDTKGTAHIFEIKVSKSSYNRGQWDSSKLLTLDYQLAFYKQLLSQHIGVKNTQLYLLPVIINTPGEPGSIQFEGLINRSNTSKNGLNNGGRVSDIVNQLLPTGIQPVYDPDKIRKFSDRLGVLFYPEFKEKLKSKVATVDDLVKRVEKRHLANPENGYEIYVDHNIEGVEKGWNKADTLEELMPIIRQVALLEELTKANNVEKIRSSLQDAIRTKSKIKTDDDKANAQLNMILVKYLSDEWDVLDDFAEFIESGLIVLRNGNTGQIDVVSISAYQLNANSREVDNMKFGDMAYMKALLLLNDYKDTLLPYGTNKIGEIVVYNPEEKTHYYQATHKMFDKFYDLMNTRGFVGDDIRLSQNDFQGVVNMALQTLNTFARSFTDEVEKESIENLIRPLIADDNLNLNKLVTAYNEFMSLYPQYKNRVFEKNINFDDKKEVLLALLSTAIKMYHQDDVGSDFTGISEFALKFSDLKVMFTSLFSDENPDYNEEGKRITGLFQGLIFTTPD